MISKKILLNAAAIAILRAAPPHSLSSHRRPARAGAAQVQRQTGRVHAANGIPCLLWRTELPTVSISGYLRQKPRQRKNRLASLPGKSCAGGKRRTGDAMDEELEFLAASVTSGISSEYATVSAQCLKKDLKRVVELFADVMMNPEFRQDRIDLAKNQANESVRRRWDMPIQAASILLIKSLQRRQPAGPPHDTEECGDYHKGD
jgi:hypothetical protein